MAKKKKKKVQKVRLKPKKPVKKKKRKPPAEKYSRSYVPMAAKFARLGLIPDEMAKFFGDNGIHPRTVKNWIEQHPEFARAIAEGNMAAKIETVEGFFIDKAIPHDEIVEIHELRGRGKKAKMTKVGKRVHKKVVDTRAGERILKAHKPELYSEKLQIPGGVNVKIKVTKKYANSNRKTK